VVEVAVVVAARVGSGGGGGGPRPLRTPRRRSALPWRRRLSTEGGGEKIKGFSRAGVQLLHNAIRWMEKSGEKQEN